MKARYVEVRLTRTQSVKVYLRLPDDGKRPTSQQVSKAVDEQAGSDCDWDGNDIDWSDWCPIEVEGRKAFGYTDFMPELEEGEEAAAPVPCDIPGQELLPL